MNINMGASLSETAGFHTVMDSAELAGAARKNPVERRGFGPRPDTAPLGRLWLICIRFQARGCLSMPEPLLSRPHRLRMKKGDSIVLLYGPKKYVAQTAGSVVAKTARRLF
jgi:hypothetical protein